MRPRPDGQRGWQQQIQCCTAAGRQNARLLKKLEPKDEKLVMNATRYQPSGPPSSTRRKSPRRSPPRGAPDAGRVREVLAKARQMEGLDADEVAVLMEIQDAAVLEEIFAAARFVKDEIYGNRLVLFAPLYISNLCKNECSYCAFRAAQHGAETPRADTGGNRRAK